MPRLEDLQRLIVRELTIESPPGLRRIQQVMHVVVTRPAQRPQILMRLIAEAVIVAVMKIAPGELPLSPTPGQTRDFHSPS